jgi:hypothetical protein
MSRGKTRKEERKSCWRINTRGKIYIGSRGETMTDYDIEQSKFFPEGTQCFVNQCELWRICCSIFLSIDLRLDNLEAR